MQHLLREAGPERHDHAAAHESGGEPDHHGADHGAGADEVPALLDLDERPAEIDAPALLTFLAREADARDEERGQEEGGDVEKDCEGLLADVQELERRAMSDLGHLGEECEQRRADREGAVCGHERQRVRGRELLGGDQVGHGRLFGRRPHQREDLEQ